MAAMLILLILTQFLPWNPYIKTYFMCDKNSKITYNTALYLNKAVQLISKNVGLIGVNCRGDV